MSLMRSTRPWRALRAMGSNSSDYLQPIARAGYEQVVSAKFGEYLDDVSSIDLVDLHQIREDHPFAQIACAGKRERIDQATCLVVDLPSDYEEYLKTLGKSLRYDVRKLDKKLFAEGKAAITPVSPDRVLDGMQILFEQHKLRWRKRGLPGAFHRKAQQFHSEWARLAANNGWLWLSLLEHDGKNVGAIYAMSMNGVCYYYQAGFDPASAAISPGTLLVAHTIKRAIGEGLSRFDFCRGDEPYKRRWMPQHAYKNYRILYSRGGMRGAAGQSWNDMSWRIERGLRARLEGRGLF